MTSRTVGAAGRARRSRSPIAQRVQVAAHGLVAAAVAQRGDLLGQGGGVGATLGPALVQVVGVAVEQAGSLQGLGLQVLERWRRARTGARCVGPRPAACDRRDRCPVGVQRGDRLVALPGPGHDPQLPHRRARCPRCARCPARRPWCRAWLGARRRRCAGRPRGGAGVRAGSGGGRARCARGARPGCATGASGRRPAPRAGAPSAAASA